MSQLTVVGALEWTYWMSVPLAVGTALFLVAFGLAYLKRVVEPSVRLQDELRAAELARLIARQHTAGQAPRR